MDGLFFCHNFDALKFDWVALRELTQSCPQYLLELHSMSPRLGKLLVIAFSLDKACASQFASQSPL